MTGKEQIKAISNIKTAAVFGNNDIKKQAVNVLAEIQDFVKDNFPQYRDIISYQMKKTDSGNSYAEIVSRRFGDDYMKKGIELSKKYRESVGYV